MYGMATLLILILAIVGCNLLEKETAQPTSPTATTAATGTVAAAPGQLSNFYVSPGKSDSFGIYMGPGANFIIANIPRAGVFLLTYYTKTGGPFFLVVNVKYNSSLFIGLWPGDEIWDVKVEEGDATPVATTTPDAQDFGALVVLFRPGFVGMWSDFIVVNPNIMPVFLIQSGAIVVSDNVVTLKSKGSPKTKKSHKAISAVAAQ
jgi:hypothetical protein